MHWNILSCFNIVILSTWGVLFEYTVLVFTWVAERFCKLQIPGTSWKFKWKPPVLVYSLCCMRQLLYVRLNNILDPTRRCHDLPHFQLLSLSYNSNFTAAAATSPELFLKQNMPSPAWMRLGGVLRFGLIVVFSGV